MNLVKAYDLAKSLKIPQLIPYSNGSNPEVLPPYVALAEIQAQESAIKRLAAAEGASTGEMPSIKEKYEQAAGLMALQGQQQQQAQQQMTSQIAQAPQPVPQGVPQPQPQPPVMRAAEGGLARLSVNPRMFDYRAGGIISFAEPDGPVPKADPSENLDAVKAQAEQAIARLRTYGTIKRQQDPEGYQQAQQAAQEAQQAVQAAVKKASEAEYSANPPYIASQKPFRNFAPVAAPVQNQVTDAYLKPSATPEGGDMGARDRGLASLAPKPAPPVAPRPAPVVNQAAPPPATPPATSPGSAALSKLQQMEMAALDEKIQPRTAAQAKAERNEATPELLRTPAGLEQLARLKQQQDQYEEGKKSRPMENWMRGLASAARGGIGGFGTSYLETAEGNRAADAAQAAYQDKVMTAVDAMRRGEATDEQRFILESVAKGRTAADADTSNRRSNIVSAAGNESQREIARLNRASQENIAELDRKLRIQLNNTPPAQRPTTEENAIRDYMKTLGITYSQAYEKVKQVGASLKGAMTLDQATDNVQKFLDSNTMHIRTIQKEAKDAGKPVPDVFTIRKRMIEIEMGGAANPSAKSSPLLSEADKIVGVK